MDSCGDVGVISLVEFCVSTQLEMEMCIILIQNSTDFFLLLPRYKLTVNALNAAKVFQAVNER